ncbi:hypothetical protein FPZ43_16070 [Mucilaginibacter pallidiroseus]|uniref:Uncharacterized protein n=1 Tax=Mucilaginibacter pallidiroseus TaxID=2599295 RepID=A0A563U368_9SPHI|nr:hypothetical protein FPZ43_16070 [Mucilaginibacter pallidiroseus]
MLAQEKDIYVEPKLVNDKGINPFNYDNKVFVDNKTYVFDYFIVKGNDTLKYAIVPQADGTKTWKYVPQNDKDSNTVSYLGIKTLGKIGPIVMENPNYKQTEVFLYHYNAKLKPLETELTGVIENKANVWLHPFRFHALEILQLSPFPYIKLPVRVGSTYLWNLDIGEKWPEFRAFDWKGKLTLNCKYVVKGTEKLALPIRTIQATKVEGIAETASGQSSLISYYNKQFGFVKLVYKNLDGSTITMTLKKVD